LPRVSLHALMRLIASRCRLNLELTGDLHSSDREEIEVIDLNYEDYH